MAEFLLQWGFTLGLLVLAISMTLMFYRSSVDAWMRSGGDWKKALAFEVGPFVTTAVKVGVGGTLFMWAVMYLYGMGQGSPVSQSLYQLGVSGANALSGSFVSAQVNIPEAPSLGNIISDNIPTEGDIRNMLGVPDSYGPRSSAVQSAPAAQQAQPAQTIWTAPASDEKLPLVMAPAVLNGEVKAYAPPAVPLVLQSAADPAPAAVPTSIPLIFNAARNSGGGPLAADADAAIAGATAKTYTVKSGDYASKIAADFGIAASVLCRHNGIRDCNNLRVGTVLQIPGK